MWSYCREVLVHHALGVRGSAGSDNEQVCYRFQFDVERGFNDCFADQRATVIIEVRLTASAAAKIAGQRGGNSFEVTYSGWSKFRFLHCR